MRLAGKDWRFAGITLGIIVIDQLTKLLATRLPLGADVPLVGKVLAFTHTRNTGAAFGMFQNMNVILSMIIIIILAAIMWYYPKIRKDQLALVALICGGAVGNLIDRLRLGYVTDFISLSFWPAFNVADAAITIGAVLLAYKVLKD